ncbi:glycosyltransferase family 4 protein [Succinivibrio faecicola]|uniref:Glycosyltransferase family 4 protein n=1 Tax=Succinivibrio faecicola TaxID=2820300 RepID=A0ABS7DHJ0_9GAMM|nr:glycosyltransferase family 4 protein [Succinivibrio faecicola]MBW7570539.1 glycosyltransferase family 4 protein [Succinivibrio faecicola]
MEREKQVKILHISRTMGQGGAEKVVFQLCKDILNVESYVASTGGEYVNELSKIGVKHFFIPDLEKKDPINLVKTFFALNKIIRKNNIKIIHSHHRMAAFYVRLLQFINSNLVHIYTAHNVFFDKKKLMRFALSKCQIVGCGKTVVDNLINYYEIKKDSVQCIYNSIEKPKYISKCNDFSENDILIGCVGRLNKQKGIDIFIKAMNVVVTKYPKIKGIIIGEGEEKKYLENLVSSLNIQEHIKFLGYRKDVFSLMNAMEFVVLPSRWEGFPLVPIETFSLGKTIIVSDIKNNLEIIKDKFNGLSFKKDDYDDLSKKIIELLCDVDFRKKLESNALFDYVNNYSYEVFLNKYLDLYTLNQ